MLCGKALETLRALLLNLKAGCSRIALLDHFAKLHRQLAILGLKFLVRRFEGLAVSFQLLDMLCRRVHGRRRKLDRFKDAGDIGSRGWCHMRFGRRPGRINLRTSEMAIEVS